MRTFHPLNEYLLLELPEKKKETDSGIIIPESEEKDAPTEGVLVEIGTEVPERTQEFLKVGDTIIFMKYTPQTYIVEGKEYVFVKFEHLLGVLKKK